MPTITTYRNGVPNWVDVSTTDVDGVAAFYSDLFGWTAHDHGEEAGYYRTFTIGDAAVAGIGPQQGDQAMPVWSTYLAVDDIDVTLAKAEEAGGTVLMPKMQVMDAGTMAVIADPTGAVVSLWQAGEHIGCQLVNEPGTVVWNELTTRDADTAIDFYHRTFGNTFVPMDSDAPEGYQMMMVGERVVGGVMPMAGEEWGDMPSHWMVYFGTADTDATAARAAELGGSVSVPPFDIPVGRIAVLNDPTGNALSVIQFAGEVDQVPDGVA